MMFVLVHSPVIGPSTWRWVAGALPSRGQDAVVPNLVSAPLAGDPVWSRWWGEGVIEARDVDERTAVDSSVRRGQDGVLAPLHVVC
jgi:hypothetical protein